MKAQVQALSIGGAGSGGGSCRTSSFFPDEGHASVGQSLPRGSGADNAAGRSRAERTYMKRPNAVEEILQREALVQSARDLRVRAWRARNLSVCLFARPCRFCCAALPLL